MKSVLISIQPKWCELIASGKKTVEVRKTAPKEVPFKAYIYCTKSPNARLVKIMGNFRLYGKPKSPFKKYYGEVNGKVIGEFVCDKVEKFNVGSLRSDDIEGLACLSYTELINYFYKPCELDGKTAKQGYAWHISELKIYDKPKELSDFKRQGYMTEEEWLFALYPHTHCHYAAWAKRFEIKGPPQSWCYVEEQL